MVEQRGIEPLTSALRTRRSAKLSYCPIPRCILGSVIDRVKDAFLNLLPVRLVRLLFNQSLQRAKSGGSAGPVVCSHILSTPSLVTTSTVVVSVTGRRRKHQRQVKESLLVDLLHDVGEVLRVVVTLILSNVVIVGITEITTRAIAPKRRLVNRAFPFCVGTALPLQSYR